MVQSNLTLVRGDLKISGGGVFKRVARGDLGPGITYAAADIYPLLETNVP